MKERGKRGKRLLPILLQKLERGAIDGVLDLRSGQQLDPRELEDQVLSNIPEYFKPTINQYKSPNADVMAPVTKEYSLVRKLFGIQ